jgi:cell division control protein 45
MGVVREGPDVGLFTQPGALVKLALWVAEAVGVLEGEKGRGKKGKKEALVLAGLDEGRGLYVVVGLGGGGEGGMSEGQKATKRKAKEEKKRAKEKERNDRREEKRRRKEDERRRRGVEGDDDEEDIETESEASEASSKDSSDDDSDDEESGRHKGPLRNRFGNAFQAVVAETGARVRIDSFEHCVVEVRKEDLSSFLEALSTKAVVG